MQNTGKIQQPINGLSTPNIAAVHVQTVSFWRPRHVCTDWHATTQHLGCSRGPTHQQLQNQQGKLAAGTFKPASHGHSRLPCRQQQHWGTEGAGTHPRKTVVDWATHHSVLPSSAWGAACNSDLHIRNPGTRARPAAIPARARQWLKTGRRAARHTVALAKTSFLPRKDATSDSPKWKADTQAQRLAPAQACTHLCCDPLNS